MKIAAVEAIAALAREPVPVEVLGAYEGSRPRFRSRIYLAKTYGSSSRDAVANAVAEAAVTRGVATRPRHLASLLKISSGQAPLILRGWPGGVLFPKTSKRAPSA